jgi:trans-aconitate methyltransferase
MSVATHLGIDLAEYDARIRTFIPHYEEMLDGAASLIDPKSRTIVDLGIGTGALAARCLHRAPKAKIIGIDGDAEVLKAAARRLPDSAAFICSTFQRSDIPACDAVVASFALHHVRTRAAKARLYTRMSAALRKGGQIVTVDCHPASDIASARQQREAWKAHLIESYSTKEAESYLQAWAREDMYVPLAAEMELMKGVGLAAEVLWRKGAFAVLRGKR